MKIKICILILSCSLLIVTKSVSQSVNYSTFGEGLQFIAKDSSFYLKFRFRFQTLYSGNYNLETDQYTDNVQIRRARLKFDGFVLNPRVKYKIELSLSNRDLSGGSAETSNTPRLIRDAVLMWNFTGGWILSSLMIV